MRLLYGERRREGVEMFVQVTYDKAADPGRLRAAFDPEGAGSWRRFITSWSPQIELDQA
jgi:hypothetical protein